MNNINLVPNKYKKSYSQKWFIALGGVGAIVCIGALVFLAFIPINKIKQEESKQIALEERLKSETIQEVKNVINQVNAKENEKEKTLLMLKEINLPSPITKKSMDVIVESAPKDFRMSKIKLTNLDSKIDITGKTKNVTNVAEYIILLHNTKQFQQINYTVEKKEDPELAGWMDYHIEMQDRTLIEKQKDLENQVNIEDEQELEETGGEDIL